MPEQYFDSLANIARKIEKKLVSPVELTDTLLDRMATLNSSFHAYSLITADTAREQASKAEREIASGKYRGPLHGMPIAVKDLFQTAGQATRCGSIVKRDWIPEADATVIARLKQAGAVILGKLNMTEFALSAYHPDLPVPVNPWDRDRWSGVSSSGSGVASALGLAFGTLGTDTGGSIRLPSAVNGVVGIKPTFGAVSKHGVFPLAYTLDHVGPITRRVEDAALMLQVIAGFDHNDPFSRRSRVPDYTAELNDSVHGMRIGIDETYCATDAHPEVVAAVLEASRVLGDLGAKIKPVNIMGVLAVCPFWDAVVAAEAAVAHSGLFPERADEYGSVFRSLLETAPHITGGDYIRARLAAAEASAIFNAVLKQVDVLLCPAAPLPAMPLEEYPPTAGLTSERGASFIAFTAPTDFSGHPTITVPCGQSSEGLPLGLQLIGRHCEEPTLIRAAHAYEQATGWHRRKPPSA